MSKSKPAILGWNFNSFYLVRLVTLLQKLEWTVNTFMRHTKREWKWSVLPTSILKIMKVINKPTTQMESVYVQVKIKMNILLLNNHTNG